MKYILSKKESRAQYYKKNKEKEKKRANQWYKDNLESAKEYQKQNRAHRTEIQIQWRKDNPEKSKQYNKNGSERIKKWVKDNPGYYAKRWEKNKIDLKYNLNHKISGGIYKSLKAKKAGKHWESIVGYPLKDLIKRLKKTMPEDYTWNDYIIGRLQIDHIIPIAVFNFTKLEHIDFKRCWALNNLRLLPAKENLRKGKRIEKEFQPALKV